MYSLMRVALAASLATSAAAVYQGFNYASTNGDGSTRTQADFEADFSTAKQLVGTSGFTSARLYTMIQDGTTNTPIEAIPAAISQSTSLLLGLWVSGGNIDNEVAALTNAINQYGSSFASIVAGISVGSEDLYRDSVIGIQTDAGVGAGPDTVVSAIKAVRSAIANTGLSSVPVGHTDTWTSWVNSSVTEVIDNCDFLGFDTYPYFQSTMANSIDVAESLFYSALEQTEAVANGKPIWVTETGWPVSGPTENQAVASVQNAQTYWDEIACALLGKTNTWWYTLYDSGASPSFGVISSETDTTPIYNLTCPSNSTTSSSASSSATATSSAASSGSASSISIPISVSVSASAQGGGSPGASAQASVNGTTATTTAASSGLATSKTATATTTGFTGGAVANSGSMGALVGAAAVLIAAL